MKILMTLCLATLAVPAMAWRIGEPNSNNITVLVESRADIAMGEVRPIEDRSNIHDKSSCNPGQDDFCIVRQSGGSR